jgi:hypothetical protein
MGLLNLTESEKLEILTLHNNARLIKEAAPEMSATVETPVSTTAVPPAATTAPLDRTSIISKIQNILKTKYNTNLGNTGPNKDGIDGKLGPRTLQSISAAISKAQSTPIDTKPIDAKPISATSINQTQQPSETTLQPAAIPQPAETTPQQPVLTRQQSRQARRNTYNN